MTQDKGMPKLTKVIDGYEFVAQGRHFLAHRNEAGFAGRAWELWEIVDYGTRSCRKVLVADQFNTRTDAVVTAVWLHRDFWSEYNAAMAERDLPGFDHPSN